jgi:glycosyltransferase involved in cell wall biosynthesis/GT2 family glycosyltransferase
MNDPLASIVVCTYNRGKYLDRCIQSLRRQSYQRTEIIIVNGPSTDETDTILQQYDHVVIIRQQQLNGLSYARNLGIKAAKGEIIAFIDDDAVADENWLRFLVEGYSDSTISGVGGLVYGPGQTHYQFDNGVIDKCGIPDAIRPPDKKIKDNEFRIFMGTNCSFRKSVLFEVGGFDPYFRYYHDESELCVRIVNAGYHLLYKRDAYVVHDMVEGHNRKSPYDLNWSEIVKNVIYFTMKNFGNEIQSYTIWPLRSSYVWLKRFLLEYIDKKISFCHLAQIENNMVKGILIGYRDGVTFNIHMKNKRQNFIASISDENLVNIIKQDGGSTGMSRLKIAYLSQEYTKNCTGGNCVHTKNLAHGLARLGHEIHIIAISERPHAYDYMEGPVYVHKIVPESIDFLELSDAMNVSKKNIAFSYSAAQKVLELKEKFGLQVVEAPLWDAQGFVTSLIKPVPLVIRLVTPLSKFVEIQGWQVTKDLKLANWLEGETIRRATKNIAISKNIAKLIMNQHSISKNNIAYGVLGIDLPGEEQLKRSQEKGQYDILFVGRLERRKGIDTLFRAIPAIIDVVPAARFTIVGKDTNLAPNGGSYQEYLVRNLDKRFHKYVNFVGFVSAETLQDYYKKADVFVAPSLYESFGQIYIEAMAWGKPVIGCDAGGIPEVIANGETGFVISPGDEHELSEKVISLLENNAMRIEMGQNARDFVKHHFTIEKMVNDTLSTYVEILSGKASYQHL